MTQFETDETPTITEQDRRNFCQGCPCYYDEEAQEKKMFADDPRHWFCQYPHLPDEETCRYHERWLEKLDNELRDGQDTLLRTEWGDSE